MGRDEVGYNVKQDNVLRIRTEWDGLRLRVKVQDWVQRIIYNGVLRSRIECEAEWRIRMERKGLRMSVKDYNGELSSKIECEAESSVKD